MAKKLALVVHGIGEQKPGETLDALVGGLTGHKACTIQSELRMLRQRDRDHPEDTPERDVKLYPCHIRRVHRGTDQTVFAEAFWGDISRGASGQVRGLIDLFTLVMGLGHIVRENLAEIYPNRTDWARCSGNFFVYLLHGPITAFNIAIALATGMLFVAQSLTSNWIYAPSVAVFATAILLIALYYWLRNDKRSYLYQIYRNWLRYTGFGLICAVILSHVVALVVDPANQAALSKVLVSQCPAKRPFSICMDYWYAALLSNGIGACWFIGLAIVVVTGGWETIRRMRQPEAPVKTLYPQAMALMFTIWMFIVVVLWSIFSRFIIETVNRIGLTTVNIDVMENGLLPALNFTFWVVAALAIITVSAVLSWLDREMWVRRVPPEDHLKRPIRRLIVHPVLLVGLTLSIGVLAYGGGETLLFQYRLATSEEHRSFADLLANSTTYEYFYRAFVPLVVLIGFGYTYFRSYLVMGIGIAKDIVVYFVRRPVECDDANPIVGDLLAKNIFPLRAQIQDRLVDTLVQLVRSEEPDEVTVIAHSQGTIISVEALRGGRLQKHMQARGLQPVAPDLITMGSPSSHLYGFYFAKAFALADDSPENDVTVGINSWTNIYRVDDFVGTTVDGPRDDFPRNLWVNARGHTNYWTDDMVLDHLRRYGFTEFAGTEL